MRISLFQKLFVTVLMSSVLAILAMAVLVNVSFKDGFQQYLNQQEVAKVESLAVDASAYYSAIHGWTRLERAPHLWASLLQQMGEMPPPPQKRDGKFGLATPRSESILAPLSSRINLIDLQGRSLLGKPENLTSSEGFESTSIPIKVGSETVGHISLLQSASLTDSLATQFLHSQSKHLVSISAATVVLSLLFAFICTRFLVQPLRALHRGAQQVSLGNLDYQITVRGNDEIADVTVAFNQLIQSLKRQEHLREQWLSDISHELRTPLAVLRGELEALQDGIRHPTVEYIESLHQQVLTLAQLVDDLRSATQEDINLQLSLEPVNFSQLVSNIVKHHGHRFIEKDLTLQSGINPYIGLNADKQKMTQVLNNLLENSYRYTNASGEVKVSLEQDIDVVWLTVEDSLPGVPDESLDKLFDRLYRVDKSRSRAHGGSGLGLSICQNIIRAHGGQIMVEHSSLGGVKVMLRLPVA